MQKQKKRPFRLEVNLDDPYEREAFINRFKTLRGRGLAHRLGLKGRGSILLANSISNYAWNRHTAYQLRENGEIEKAIEYERIADDLYERDIAPVCICW